MTFAAAWYPDPLARHDYRYWDGATWTANVSDHGQTSLDELGEDPEHLTFRSQAAKNLGRTKDARAVPALLAYLYDDDSGIRLHAMQSLIRIPAALDPLVRVLASKDLGEQAPVAQALWELVRLGYLKDEPLAHKVIAAAIQLAYFSGQPARANSLEYMQMLALVGDERGRRLLALLDADDLAGLEQLIAHL